MNEVLVGVFTDAVLACLGVLTILWTVKASLTLGTEIGELLKRIKKA